MKSVYASVAGGQENDEQGERKRKKRPERGEKEREMVQQYSQQRNKQLQLLMTFSLAG